MALGQIHILDTQGMTKDAAQTQSAASLVGRVKDLGYSVLHEKLSDISKLDHQNETPLFVYVSDLTVLKHPRLSALFQSGYPAKTVFIFTCALPCALPTMPAFCDDVILSQQNAEHDAQAISSYVKQYKRTQRPNSLSREQLQQFATLNVIGDSTEYQSVLKQVMKVSTCNVPVLVSGETGTGKELVSRAIHYFSDRTAYGFLPLNCAALPDSLFESELFGHEKGAFTNANQRHHGLVELADQGTLFLDEVDSLSEKAQSALLRFLQSGEYRPVGSNKVKHANTRIVAATNKDLKAEVAAGRFREDLLFRLSVLNINIPPLRERLSDINQLAPHLINSFAKIHGKGQKILHPSYIDWLKTQEWPGNVRELLNFLLSDYLMSDSTLLRAPSQCRASQQGQETNNAIDAFSQRHLLTLPYQSAKEKVLEQFNTTYLQNALHRSGGNVTLAAQESGKERRAFGKLVKRYGLSKSTG